VNMNMTNMRDAQKQYLEYVDLLKDGQKAIVNALEFWGSAFDEAAGKPASRHLLEPKEFVEQSFEVIERVLEAQRQVLLALVDSAS
jgi:hypothetical protein